MATKKNSPQNKTADKTVITKIAEKVGELAARIVNEKEHLAEMAGSAIKTVKATIHNATAEKKSPGKKAGKPGSRKVAKIAAKKIARPAAKKAAPAKKAPKKKSAKKR